MSTLSTDLLRLTISPSVGAGIADFSLKGPSGFFFPLMRRAAPDESNSSLLSSFFMLPWVNRIRAGRFTFNNQPYAIRTNTADGMAQHGDVRKRPWALTAHSATSATLDFDSRSFSDINWPWSFSARAVYTLSPSPTGGTLAIDLSLRNTDSTPFPAACGHHPYFSRRLFGDADDLRISLPVAAEYPLQSGCAIAASRPTELSRALSSLAPVPARHIDAVFTADPALPNTARLHWPASNVTLDITASDHLRHWILYAPHAPSPAAAPSTAPHPASNPAPGATSNSAPSTPLPYIAIEPQSQVNDALNLAAATNISTTGTITLNPGDTLTTRCEFTVQAKTNEPRA